MSVVYINPFAVAPALQPYQFSAQYSHTRNDGYTFEETSTWSYSGVAVQVGRSSSSDDYNAYFWFDNITVPAGAIITNATFDLEQRTTNSISSRQVGINWYGVLQPNPTYPSNYTEYHTSPLTTNYVTNQWTRPVTQGEITYAPNLATVVQELVNQPGWTSGNNMCFHARYYLPYTTYYWSWYSNSSRTRTFTIDYLAP